MPTTAGSLMLKGAQPDKDAFAVKKLRDAGALILGKANLQEFASGGISVSSLGGQVKNPYDLTRTPGGSSGGTATAVASNFATAGTGSDTGGSIRSPASAEQPGGTAAHEGIDQPRRHYPRVVYAGHDRADHSQRCRHGKIARRYGWVRSE